MNEVKKDDYFELTNPQKSIVTTEIYYNEPRLSVIAAYVEIKEKVNQDKLVESLNIFIKNCDAINIRFKYVDGVLKQYIDDSKPVVEKLRFDSHEQLEKTIKKITFELIDSRLYYIATYETKDNKNGYIMIFHHSIADAWSETIFITKVNETYDALINNKKEYIPKIEKYKDAILEEKNYLESNNYIKDKEFFENDFSNEIEKDEIHIKNKNTLAKRILFDVPNKYLEYCENNKISAFSFFFSAIYIYFSKIYNSDSMVIGTPVLNRLSKEAKNTFGMIISTEPFKIKVESEKKAIDFIKEIMSKQFSILKHQRYPMSDIQKYYNKKFGYSENLYNILYSYQNARVNNDNFSFKYESKWVFTECQTDLLDINFFDIDDTNNIKIGFDYLIEYFKEKEIKMIGERIFEILNQIINNSNILIKDIEITTIEERKKLLKEYNNTYKKYDENLNISKLFEEKSKEYPNNIALTYDGNSITYKELNQKVNFLAKKLRDNGIKNNDIVGIMMYRSFEMVISQLAILKSGGAYLPIDPAYPKDRVNYILEDSKCNLLLIGENIEDDEYKTKKIKINYNDFKEIESIPNISKKDDLAYIIYTSGSTGKPKGVAIQHKSIINTLLWRRKEFNFDKSYVTMQIPSFSFDSSVEDIFTTLISGGHLILLKQNNTNFDIPQIKEIIKKYKVNHFLAVPSFYTILLRELGEELKNAKMFTVAGEGFSEVLVKKHFEVLPNVRLVNEYGPTENSVCSTFFEFTKDNTAIRIGKPITNCECYVLNKDLKLMPIGVKGELYVSGVGLAKEYLGREKLTKERFIKNPFKENSLMYKTGDVVVRDFDGNLIFLERVDFQIKYNGFRINLGEIESQISKALGISNVVAVLKKEEEHSFIASFIESKEKLDIKLIRNTISKFLPHYMVPKEIIVLAELPKTPNGKIDRKNLEKYEIKSEKKIIIAPRNDLDKKILEIWKKILNKNEISIDDNIFDLGGDSLSIISIQALLFKNNIKTLVQDLFEYTTIEQLSDYISNNNKDSNLSSEEKNYPKEFKRLYKDDGISNLEKDNIPKNIFLTGSTGFLGAHILKELLDNKNTEKIFLLIRKRANLTVKDRILKTLNYYFDGKYIDEIDKRIIIYQGDLSEDYFGMKKEDYDILAKNTESIINCASLVKHYGKFEYSYKSNVISVKNIIKFAKESKCKINYISTTTISGNYLLKDTFKYNFTENDFYIGQKYKENIYVRTKFEAEALLFEAQKEGLNINIFRLGNLMSRFSDGKFQDNKTENAFYNRLKSFINFGKIPTQLKKFELEFTPVDITAQMIVKLMNYKNKVYHLQNDNLVSIERLNEELKKYRDGIEFVSNVEFLKIATNDKNSHDLDNLITDFANKNELDYKTNITISDEITKRYFKLENIYYPKITAEYLDKFIEELLKD